MVGGWGYSIVLIHLSSKCKALDFIPTTIKPKGPMIKITKDIGYKRETEDLPRTFLFSATISNYYHFLMYSLKCFLYTFEHLWSICEYNNHSLSLEGICSKTLRVCLKALIVLSRT